MNQNDPHKVKQARLEFCFTETVSLLPYIGCLPDIPFLYLTITFIPQKEMSSIRAVLWDNRQLESTLSQPLRIFMMLLILLSESGPLETPSCFLSGIPAPWIPSTPESPLSHIVPPLYHNRAVTKDPSRASINQYSRKSQQRQLWLGFFWWSCETHTPNWNISHSSSYLWWLSLFNHLSYS